MRTRQGKQGSKEKAKELNKIMKAKKKKHIIKEY